jgi:hypothetical protein
MRHQDEPKSIELKMHCQPLFWARAGGPFIWLAADARTAKVAGWKNYY